MASSLAFVPNDILVSILAFIDCVSLIRVYQCGDNRLNDRLLKSVTRFDLVYSNYVKMKFPIIIRHFTGLKSLTVRLYNNLNTPKCDYDLISLPNSLTSLHVPQERPLFEIPISSSSEGLQTHVLDLSCIFPNLTSLVTPLGSYEPSDNACLEWIEKLPRNLIEMHMNHLILGSEHIAALPRPLRQLRVNLDMKEDENRDWNFPPDLRYLSLPCYLACPDFEKYLPLQLESLVLDASETYGRRDTRFEYLPRSLTVLEGAGVEISTSHCFGGLPKGMKRLTIGCASIQTIDVVYPACLKEIFGTSTLSPSDTLLLLSSFPSDIEDIDANLFRPLPSDQWHLLPRKLRKMTIWTGTVLSEDHATFLPSDLEDVFIYKPSDQFLGLLPKHITSLTLGNMELPFNPSILNSLHQLKTLDLRSGVNVRVSGFLNFTPKLTTLKLHRTSSEAEVDLRLPWTSQLDEFLGEPYLPASSAVEDPPKDDLIECETEIRQTNSLQSLAWWTPFSHTLTSITIYGNASYIYSSHLDIFPPHLTTIVIPGIYIDEHLFLSLRRLPQSIEWVSLYEPIIQPGTNQHLGEIQTLPPNLTRLSLKRLENKNETISLAKQLRPWLKIFVSK